MKHICCDDGSTNVKLAWFDDEMLNTTVSANSFRAGWKVEGMGAVPAFNYQVNGMKYTADNVSHEAISTTNVEYQYGDMNLLAVHHALLNSRLTPQEVSLTVTLPVSEFYDGDCQRNEDNIRRKKENLLRPLVLNRGKTFTVSSVSVMPESLPAVFSQLAMLKVGPLETSLVVDLGGTTLDAGVLVGQFEDVSAIHGNPGIGVSMVTRAAMNALRSAGSETSPFVADTVVRQRTDRVFLNQVINDATKVDSVVTAIEAEIASLSARVVSDLARWRNVNRVFLVGGGALLIEPAIRNAWNLAPERIMVIHDPQTALAREMAHFKN
ncbi:plasmid segregation protein ParM domain-containing protein [Erwinia sp. MYb416]|uniref:plasmid segregation protein ParM domain-containing protein n=1 Tax=Erwinia sp. MYb416 TaxID=3108532 RepID=UPI0030B46085